MKYEKRKAAWIMAVLMTLPMAMPICGQMWALAEGLSSAYGTAAKGYVTATASENMATDSDGIYLENNLEDVPIEIKATVSQLATLSQFILPAASTGDLWSQWTGDYDWPGDGTEYAPYQISTLAQLMGLAQIVSAGINDFKGAYIELTRDIDLGTIPTSTGCWNPIGWYENVSELGGAVAHPFRGTFDGAGHVVSGVKIINIAYDLDNIGFFGVIDGGRVKNLTVEAQKITGNENVGVLAGAVYGDSIITNVTVTGEAGGKGDTGGIAGEADGGSHCAVIENCTADAIVLNSEGTASFVGGIVGDVQSACLIDNTALTQSGDTNRIRGKGYVGGIAGRMNHTDIFNSYVDGTIGGNGAKAVGGIVGKYESGSLILARMAADISRTNNGAASQEGTFVGMREPQHNFTYGTETNNHLSFLYTNSAAKAKQVFGSKIAGDNTFTKSAHIGWWMDHEKKYATIYGNLEEGCGDRYFYEELEDGVRYIITKKLGNDFTSTGYYGNLDFCPDHYAPGYMGEPVKGYLVTVPRIDARNSNGTYDTNVAVLTALPSTNSTYYRTIHKDRPAAVAPGAVVTVLTAPNNTNQDRYQMVVDENEEGALKPPTYTRTDGTREPMEYITGGGYSFIMPEGDTTLEAEYIKVTTKLTLAPAQTSVYVIHTRSGDRKAPEIVTEVKNAEGILIARYINDALDTDIQVQPVKIHVSHNSGGHTGDRTVQWSVDDVNLLNNQSDMGYTEKDAAILPNMKSAFIQDTLNRQVQAQAAGQYKEKINNTTYTRAAVVTAATNRESSVDYQPVYANCRVNINFQIVDNTTLRVEGIELNKTSAEFTVTRKLTGNQKNPTSTITCSQPIILSATLMPTQVFYKNIFWKDIQGGKLLDLVPSGEFRQDCKVTVKADLEGKNNPSWIQNVILETDARKAENPSENASSTVQCQEVITAASEDQTHGHLTVSCPVTIKFVTVDETVRSYGSSGGSSGGGGNSSSVGVKVGAVTSGSAQIPSYVVVGTWFQNAEGKWLFTDGSRTYANEWAAIYNPYANTEAQQSPFDWFCFDREGFMLTGWFTDHDGNVYYLHPESDGTQGRMYTGWNWIDEKQYFFNQESDGTKGALKPEPVETGG